ncbi:transglutaminase family protein [Methanobrevibacter sp.]|uniref:transglutaminase-like domain-containing protein n=1 Tax=Methanobrevibacter sp. TaxID=66852 RepID=UPI00388E724C
MIFLIMGSVSAMDSNVTNNNSNLLNENNNLEVSSYDSISETTSHEDNITMTSSSEECGLLTAQYISDDIVRANDVQATSLTGNDTELYFKNGTAFKVALSDSNGLLLANQSVIFNINGNNYTRETNDAGIASIAINLIPGEYSITSFFEGTSSYQSSSTTNVVKVLSTISGEDIEKFYKNDTQYYVTLVDGQGKLLSDTTVNLNINGVMYERKTNVNGTARLNINLIPGKYVITATNTVNGEMHSNNITVLSTVHGDDVVKYYKNDTQYYATFLNSTGSPLANTNVSFNINGVFYNRTTNSDGTARMNINLNPDNYTITSTNPINGELWSNNIEVLPTISTNDLNMIYRNDRFTANVLDDEGNPSVNDTVTFNINGVFYNRTSDDEGNAYLNINLDVGQYIITSTNSKGLSSANTITVNKADTTITGSDAYMIVGIPMNYTVTLIGENNKTVNSDIVHFRYDDRYVDAVTDENGKATLNIDNITIGTYPIEYWYDGNLNYYPSASSSRLIVSNSTVLLIADDLDMVYKDGSKFNVTLIDLENNPLANRTITFNINGKNYNRTTNDDGIASIAINLFPGVYTIDYSHSHVNSSDYNVGSRTIVVNKLHAEFVTEDYFMEHGDKGTFIAKLVDENNNAISNATVIFNIHDVDYYRVTNESGIAKIGINLFTGYYKITTALDNFLYEANTQVNFVLVNGTLLEATDIEMVVGTTEEFAAFLYDAYYNPIPDKTISFYYNGVQDSAVTDYSGRAAIQVSGLPKGDHPIVYSYDDNKCMAYIHVIGTISINDLVSAANNVNRYIEANVALPSTVAVGDETFTTAQYLYLLSEAIVGISNGDYSDLYVSGVIVDPTEPGAAADMGNLYDYADVAATLLNFMDSYFTPDSVDTSVGTVGYDGIVYAFTRVIVYYGLNNQLPGSVSIRSLKVYEAQSVLDNKNTITDLGPYLSSSTNCQVTNQAIVNLANRLTAGLTNSYDKAVAIYNYVRDEISYSFYYDTHYGAAGTLNAGTGNCVDQSHLSVALYRAAGLPARYVHGTCVFSSGSTYGHVWCQVLLGDTWIVSDSTSNRNSFDHVVNWNNYNYDLNGYYADLEF